MQSAGGIGVRFLQNLYDGIDLLLHTNYLRFLLIIAHDGGIEKFFLEGLFRSFFYDLTAESGNLIGNPLFRTFFREFGITAALHSSTDANLLPDMAV